MCIFSNNFRCDDKAFESLEMFKYSMLIPMSCAHIGHPTRCHIITQFNQGFYDYIIATDEQSLADPTAAAAQAPAAKGKKKKATEKGGK